MEVSGFHDFKLNVGDIMKYIIYGIVFAVFFLPAIKMFAVGEAEIRFGTEVYLPIGWSKAQYLPGGTATQDIDIFTPSVPQFGDPTMLGATMSTGNVSAKKIVIVPFYKRIAFLEYEEIRDELKFLRPLREEDGVSDKDILAEVKQGGKTFNTMFAIGDKFTYVNKNYTISEIRELTPEEQENRNDAEKGKTENANGEEEPAPILFVILEGEDGLNIPVPFNVNISPKYFKLTFKDLKNGKLFYASYPGDIKVCDKNGNIIETYKVGGLYEDGVVLVDGGKRKHGVPKVGKP